MADKNKKSRETIGVCEGLCGGLVDHHLIDGLCPACRANKNIISTVCSDQEYDGYYLGGEATVTIPDQNFHGNQKYIQSSKLFLLNGGFSDA